ncbi:MULTISPECIES: LysR family transcriptional regulator [unclassified Fusibacter]|uniref:LysR family transcriptional regulator n=1 Tax=unclassified Fusibacter TaxID=2624464 RepID=UPI001013B0BD|nr:MULTISPECIES: LysR family transcriptional regulator [unclassified Fusibacter]MCK8058440.1 LysR family transcriptional regulator [Fusibacter sp. A2]NPE22792.1 LysR family transcriptional regulator [Fusibacter sp. A1]RXV60348.1 LysR family transcriptional regulator [Fusibacter sp. A1]
MDLRQLQYFISVCEEKSFTKASLKLHVSQPSISKSVKTLETELGIKLINRDSKQIQITDVGKLFLKNSKDLLKGFDALTQELSQITELKRGKIHIGIPPIVGASFFPNLIGAFKTKYPDIELQLMEVGTKDIEEAIISSNIDVGIICNISNKLNQLEQHLLLQDPIRVVVSNRHILANKNSISFCDLCNEKFVMYSKTFSLYDRILYQCHRYGFSPTIVCESSQRDLITEIVHAEYGIALLPERTCQNLDKSRFKVIPLDTDELYLEMSLVWKKNKTLSYATREWIDYTLSYFLD